MKPFYESDSIGGANTISRLTTIKGDVVSEGDIRVDGSIDGLLNVKGCLTMGSEGLIKGDINCQNAEIGGSIEGNINVSEHLVLLATAVIKGDINIGKLSIEPGAVLSGKVSMSVGNNYNRASQEEVSQD